MKGYSNELYILAFDHRGTLTKGLLGVEGRPPNEEEASRVSSMKDIIFDGFIEAKETGIGTGEPAILVDETFGLQVQQKAKEMGVKFAAPVEKSGQKASFPTVETDDGIFLVGSDELILHYSEIYKTNRDNIKMLNYWEKNMMPRMRNVIKQLREANERIESLS